MSKFAAFIAALLIAAPALADEPLREGATAFGDWRSDGPGVRRLIRPDDLPAPYTTPSAAMFPHVAPRPSGFVPTVPKGFTVDLVAQDLKEPRVLRVAPNGDVFLAESGAGQVRVYRFDEAGGAKSTVLASGLDRPFGIAFYPAANPQWVYVAETNAVVRYPYRAGETIAHAKPETVVAHLPTGGHWTRDIVFSSDDKTLFVSLGSATNIGEASGGMVNKVGRALGVAPDPDDGRAVVLAFDPDGMHRRVYADGLRNCSGLAVQPGSGALWCVVNERDGLGDDLVPDYATRLREGAFYGWPWYYIGDHVDPRHKGERPELADKVATPEVLLQAHSAPLAMAFYESEEFPSEYRGDAFVTMHGSWNRAKRTGYKIVRIRMANGAPTGEYDDFLTGFVGDNKTVYGRPVGVAVTKDGALLLSDDGGGALWRVRYQGP